MNKKLSRAVCFVIAISFISILFIPISSFAAVGDTGTYGYFTYKIISDTAVAITKYTGNETEVTVPETIGNYTVTKIGNAAFQDQNLVQKIVLPETITEISDVNVFWYCRSLKYINLPNSLTYLSTGAFTMCTSLEEVIIPDGVTRLSKTFRGCSSLTKVVIPDSVTSIDQYTFADNIGGTNLLPNVTIYCNAGSYAQTFATQNGINCVITSQNIEFNYVTNSDGENTITVTGIKNNAVISGDFVMPAVIDGYTVTQIGYEVFKDQNVMTSFVMPDTVTSISFSVFWACSSLKTVHLSQNLTGALNGTFGYCTNLEKVNIPQNITSIRKTFISCKNLKSLHLPSSLTMIETQTFQNCIALKSIYMPQSINSIASDAFLYCTTTNITAYVDSIDTYAAGIAQGLNMNCVVYSNDPFSVESREVLIRNNKPVINVSLKNNSYIGECTALAAVYEDNPYNANSNILYDFTFTELNVDFAQTENISFAFDKAYKEDVTYKIIILDSNLQPLLVAVERAVEDKDADLEKYPTLNLFDSNASGSSWDKAVSTENFGVAGWANLTVEDYYNYLPCEAYRSFPEIVDRKVTVDFDFSMSTYMENTRFSILNGQDIIVGFITKDTYLYLEQNDGSLIRLGRYTPYSNYWEEDAKCYVRAVFDLEKGIIDYVRVDGVMYELNVPLTNDSNTINGFDVLTDVTARGSIINRQLKITCDYIVNEEFTNKFGALPQDWTYEMNGSTTSVYAINSRVPDCYSIDVDTENGDFKAVKSFEKETGNPVFEIMVLQPEKRSGLSFSLKSGNKKVLEISADGDDFVLECGETSESIYTYQPNVWYGLKAEVDLINSKANIFVNNDKVLSDVDIDINDFMIDSIEIYASQNSKHFIYDDVKLYKKRIIPNDYVPRPVKPTKSGNYMLGVQVCNLWTEGQYNKTWDYIKSAPNRLPVFGPYDEGNYEMNDWEIKWLLEHGIDYELIWAYPNIKHSSADTSYGPIKPNVVREGHYIYDGFMNAEYSDMMKFAISFENDAVNYSNGFYDEFFETYVPYWIEYYFKNSRYLKIDGRPIFGVYAMDKFLGIFGTMGEDDAAINQGIARFRQMCIDAGVGNPYIISHGFGYTESTFSKYSVYDIDCIGLASWPKHEGLTWQKSDIKSMATLGNRYNLDFAVTLQPKQDMAAWEGRTGVHSSAEEFTNALTWVKNELPSLITHSSLSKNLFNILTWNEFGEGHILMPTNDDGFTYLDCIRNVFVGQSSHTDFVPVGEQVKRINRMVDNDRLVTQVRENPIPYYPDDLSSLSVKKGWYFSSADDYADWTTDSSATISNQNGNLVVTAVSNYPTITLTDVPDMELYDVTYVKVRMKGNTTSCGGNIKWTTDVDGTFDDIKRTYLETPLSTASTMTDYYIPIGQSVHRTGHLTGLKLTPELVLDKSQKIQIESIELLSDNNITNGAKIVYNNVTTPLENEPVYQNGTLMVPIRDVVKAVDLTLDWFEHDNSYIIYRYGYNKSNATTFAIGSTSAKRGTTGFTLNEAPYCVSNKINDTVYVPVDLIERGLRMQYEWDANEKILTIIY